MTLNGGEDDQRYSSSTKTLNCTGSDLHSPTPDLVLEIVLENVLRFLTSRHDCNAASLVCKSWWCTEALTRSDLFIGNCYAISPRRATARFSRVRFVIIKGKPRFANFDLMPLNWGDHFSSWATVFAETYLWLEKVHLKRMSVTDEDLFLVVESFPSLKELVLVCYKGFRTSGLAAIATMCRLLRVLDLVDSVVGVMDDYEGVDWIWCFPEGETHLESLVFDCVECPVNFEALVARSPSLKRLKLNRHVSLFHLYRLMYRAPHLTHLGTGSFDAPDSMNAEDYELVRENPFAASKSLVCLSGFIDIWADYLPAIYPVCANLTSLNFSYADINVDQFKYLISYCHKLQTLWVLDTICDKGLQVVAATCKDLRELRVFPINTREEIQGPVSEVGFEAISRGCRKLQSILFFCQRMTNAAVVAMSKYCPDLVVFRLCIIGRYRSDPETHEPMDEGFGAIVMNCKKLTRLAMSGLLTDRAFAHIGMGSRLGHCLLPLLEKLTWGSSMCWKDVTICESLKSEIVHLGMQLCILVCIIFTTCDFSGCLPVS